MQHSTAMRKIESLNTIVSQDPAVHLNCRVHQMLALVAAKTSAVDLLYHGALHDSHRVFEHCYLKKELRWSYPYPYTRDDDLRQLGFTVRRSEHLGLGEFLSLLTDGVARDEPVSFFAPRTEFAYQVQYMSRMGLPLSGILPHSFLACGVDDSVTELLIRDDATDNHEFADFVVPWETVRSGWETNPDEWFTDVLVLKNSADEPDPAHFDRAYTKHVLELEDAFEIYHLLHDRLAEEREGWPTFAAPGLNSLSMLAGAHILFCRFLRHTRHSERVKETFRRNMKFLCSVLDEATLNHVERAPSSDARIKRGLFALERREAKALGLLRQEVEEFRTAGVEAVRFPVPSIR
ncbi:hypothetical protein [Streptomyces sp. NRRL S-646]|uniref:hypothetical protein n=1 Tax=Streptomyces sp. NRRL S-646 TaxID=1463917 RepID=UPI001331835B|nr:hypothetical protein [Streptomyces sp. NRRL S-646]